MNLFCSLIKTRCLEQLNIRTLWLQITLIPRFTRNELLIQNLVLLSFSGIESSMCNPGIEINQAKLGMSQGQQVWNATLSNTCTCTLLQVKLSIPNFDSVTKINTTIISKYMMISMMLMVVFQFMHKQVYILFMMEIISMLN